MSILKINLLSNLFFVKVMTIIFGFLSASLLLVGMLFIYLLNPVSNHWGLLIGMPIFMIYSFLCMCGLTFFSCRKIKLE